MIIRTTKKMELTYRGQQLYQYANHILNVRDNIVSEFSEEEPKAISMGVSAIPSTYILPEIMKKYKQQHTDISFHIWQSSSRKVIDKVLDGTIDVGLTSMTVDEGNCVFVPFFKDELVIAAPNNEYFRKLKEEQVDFRMLLKEPLILHGKESGTQKEIEEIFRINQIDENDLRIVARMNDLESMKSAVLNELGISIFSTLSIRELTASGKLIEFPLGSTAIREIFALYTIKNVF